jgi:hypothetical protein
MIEKYFQCGVRLLWNKPADAKFGNDGTIVGSAGAATPMSYDGLDGQLQNPRFGTVNVTQLGFKMGMNIPYSWLDYAPGRSAKLAVGGNDVFTGYMSGCLLVRWQEGGTTYVAHIGTINGDEYKALNRTVKDVFMKQMPPGITGFNPASAWDHAELNAMQMKMKPPPRFEVFGLLTTNGDFYAVALGILGIDAKTARREWCVAGCKKVSELDHAGLVTAFNRIN